MAFGFGFGAPHRTTRGSAAGLSLPAYASIATFGDSITAGSSALATANRWANRLATALGASLSNQGIAGTVLQNSADAGGAPMANNGRDRFAVALTGVNKKAAAFICYGFNDARYIGAPGTFNVTQYTNDYREMLNGLVMGGYELSDIYVAAPYHITDTGLVSYGADPNFSGQSRAGFEAYVAATAQVAAEFGVRYCDLYTAVNSPDWIANVDAGDHIHPDDAGHAYITTAWLTRTVETNARPRPASVANIRNGANQIDATCAAIAGATSYELALVSAFVNLSTQSGASLSASFTSLAAGDYRVKARGVFADGGKGPWTFASADISIAAPTGIFISDSFTAAAGSNLVGHMPETGGAWSLQPGASTSAGPKISSAGRLYQAGTVAVMQNAAVAGGADMYVAADLVALSIITGNSVGLGVRMQAATNTLYWSRYLPGTGWQIFKTINGTTQQLGSTVAAPALVAGQTKQMRLEVTGTIDPVLTLRVDGTSILTATDNAGTRITAAGKAGIRSITGGTIDTDTTGIHMDNFKADTL